MDESNATALFSVSHKGRLVEFFEEYVLLFNDRYDQKPIVKIEHDDHSAQFALDWLYRA